MSCCMLGMLLAWSEPVRLVCARATHTQCGCVLNFCTVKAAVCFVEEQADVGLGFMISGMHPVAVPMAAVGPCGL
jgi:hypothetical protein